MYSKCDPLLFSWQQRGSRVSLIRLLHVCESVATQWVLATVSLGKSFLWLFLLDLAPFAVCFAVLWMVRRKSGWGTASCLLVVVSGSGPIPNFLPISWKLCATIRRFG